MVYRSGGYVGQASNALLALLQFDHVGISEPRETSADAENRQYGERDDRGNNGKMPE